MEPAPQPLRLQLGLVALVFYLWVIHSYKLAAGDVAILALGAGLLLKGEAIRIPVPLRWFAAFIVWSALGFAVTISAAATTDAMLSLVKLWVIAFCIVNVVHTAAELRFVMIAWLGLFALYPVRGALFNQYICRCTEFGRVAWNFIFSNPNDLATLSILLLGLAASVWAVERVKLWRYLAMAGVLVLTLLIMLTQSRAALLGLGAGALLLPLTSRKRTRDLVLLAGLVGAAAIAAPRDVWVRLAGLARISVSGGMQGVDPEGSAESRWQIWQVAIRTIQEEPLVGVGIGAMPIVHRNEANRTAVQASVAGVRDTHSTYLRIAAETGIPGLILYLGIWVSLFAHLRRARKAILPYRPREQQLLSFMEISLLAFMVAAGFGSYGLVSFTYLAVTVAWLAGTILAREPWYAPAGARTHVAVVPRRA